MAGRVVVASQACSLGFRGKETAKTGRCVLQVRAYTAPGMQRVAVTRPKKAPTQFGREVLSEERVKPVQRGMKASNGHQSAGVYVRYGESVSEGAPYSWCMQLLHSEEGGRRINGGQSLMTLLIGRDWKRSERLSFLGKSYCYQTMVSPCLATIALSCG